MRRSPLLPIFLIVLVDVLGMTIVLPLLAIYSERFGASAQVASLLMPTFAACQLVAGPILGRLSDRLGRRPVLLVSQLGTLAGFVMLAEANALWMVFAGRILDGLTAGNLTVAQAYIADHTPPERRARSFALIGIAFGVGFLIGPVLTAVLTHWQGYAAPFWAAAGLSALSITGTLFLLPPDEPASARAADDDGPGGRRLGILDWGAYVAYFRRPALGRLLTQFFLYMFAFSMFTGGFTLFAERHLTWDGALFTPREIGIVFAYLGLIGALIQGGLIGRLVSRHGERRLTAAAFVSLALGYACLAAGDHLVALVAAATLAATGTAILRPSITSLVTRSSGKREQGVVLGLTQALSSIAAIVAPPLSGFLIQHEQHRAWALVAAGAAALGLLFQAEAAPPADH